MDYEKILRGGVVDIHSYIWDTGTLSWVPATGGGAAGDVNVTNFPASYPVTGGFLTDTELRATAVPVSGPLTDTQLRNTAVPVSGPLTDTQIRSTALPVSGPLTDTELRTTDVKVSLDGEQIIVSDQPYTTLIDEVSATVTYIGEAVTGTAVGSAAWRIKKIDSSSGIVIAWADGVSTFIKIWTSRTGYSYS